MSTFSERLLLAWHAYERQVGHKVNGRAFAEAIGVSKTWLSEWQGEEESPPHERIAAIAKTTGVDPGWLAYGELSDAPMVAQSKLEKAFRRWVIELNLKLGEVVEKNLGMTLVELGNWLRGVDLGGPAFPSVRIELARAVSEPSSTRLLKILNDLEAPVKPFGVYDDATIDEGFRDRVRMALDFAENSMWREDRTDAQVAQLMSEQAGRVVSADEVKQIRAGHRPDHNTLVALARVLHADPGHLELGAASSARRRKHPPRAKKAKAEKNPATPLPTRNPLIEPQELAERKREKGGGGSR